VSGAAVNADGALNIPVSAARARGHAAQRLHGAPERAAAPAAPASRRQSLSDAAQAEAAVVELRWWRRGQWWRPVRGWSAAPAGRRPRLTLKVRE
jgi:hypothetical protein